MEETNRDSNIGLSNVLKANHLDTCMPTHVQDTHIPKIAFMDKINFLLT